MPAKNALKKYVEGGIYHIYNRGVEKRDVFTDIADYKTFMYFLKQYLLSEDDPKKDIKNFSGRTSLRRSFEGRIELLAYCLMPNHFHLILRQKDAKDITEFMKCLSNSYSAYFNDRHDRVGSLFQGRYKAVLVENDSQLLQLSRYIHRNPIGGTDHFDKGPSFVDLASYDYSSYQDYLGHRSAKWVHPKFILDIMDEKGTQKDQITSYQKFTEGQDDPGSFGVLNRLTIE